MTTHYDETAVIAEGDATANGTEDQTLNLTTELTMTDDIITLDTDAINKAVTFQEDMSLEIIESKETAETVAIDATGAGEADSQSEPTETVEPTLEALAKIWGAQFKPIRGKRNKNKGGKASGQSEARAQAPIASELQTEQSHPVHTEAVNTEVVASEVVAFAEALAPVEALTPAEALASVVQPASEHQSPEERPATQQLKAVVPVTDDQQAPEQPPVDSVKAAFIKSLTRDELTIVSGTVLGIRPGLGAFVDLGSDTIALLHISQLAGKNPAERDAALLEMPGKTLDFVVARVDLEKLEVRLNQSQLSVARERIRLAKLASEQANFINSLVVGERVSGTVKRALPRIGALVDLGPTVALWHVSQFKGSRPERDAALASLSIGEPLELKVLSVNKAKQEVRLSQREVAVTN